MFQVTSFIPADLSGLKERWPRATLQWDSKSHEGVDSVQSVQGQIARLTHHAFCAFIEFHALPDCSHTK